MVVMPPRLPITTCHYRNIVGGVNICHPGCCIKSKALSPHGSQDMIFRPHRPFFCYPSNPSLSRDSRTSPLLGPDVSRKNFRAKAGAPTIHAASRQARGCERLVLRPRRSADTCPDATIPPFRKARKAFRIVSREEFRVGTLHTTFMSACKGLESHDT